ncbi:uncharacterized protein K452DRAFT_293997 [Aplosporella prunicola CBS 121167]|uniref:Uncharacterized protein n=1 Tax=Aplosporella prunicola CBS 121167 TaxID=1176127 RepID=A0A6A6BTZ2_9PEZI|nr:uncharacterized protein K452DRAFT_293997 [Aplosporella prunicola CBS 121167]KAF2147599.1 hypothetical protein K452DRAFT_293997 [Aplosporella prunicola CBS 121167]
MISDCKKTPYGHYQPAEPKNSKLEYNFGLMAPEAIGFLVPTTADTPMKTMRQRFAQDGYRFVRKTTTYRHSKTIKSRVKILMPRDTALQCRLAYFEHMAPSNLLKPNIYSGAERKYLPPGNLRMFGLKDDPESDKYVEFMISAHITPFYLNFYENKELHELVRRFTVWEKEVMLHRTILWAFAPNLRIYACALRPHVPLWWVTGKPHGVEKSVDIRQITDDEFARNASNSTKEERTLAFNKTVNDGAF